MKHIKTNAMRVLDTAKIEYKTHSYDTSDGHIDGVSVAEKLKEPLEQVFKTLVTKGHTGAYYVFVIPVAKELNLKAAAKSVGEKSVEMINVKDINKVTGYIRGGCSPIGMKKHYLTVIDKSCEALETMIVSGGKIGYQIEMRPKDLISLIEAKVSNL
ncbi:Cys-tRNA(Pro) deacylase [Alloiococcus sp. CFN-8]|uniref:Cys-tRNA(Pro) deacylase n=1 Tax=Alloiococcus sp. CFN-8 TaxID=3416081 RepID=UPI003CE8D2F1